MKLPSFTRDKRRVPRAPGVDRRNGPPNAFLPVEYTRLDPVEVNFNDQWQLTALQFAERRRRFTLAMRWRCLRTLFRMPRCFAHVAAIEGHCVAFMDHDIMDGQPNAVAWQPGDEGLEFSSVDLPERQQEAAGYSLHFGLFDPQTNLRLPITASTLPVTDDFTAAVFGTHIKPAVSYSFRLHAEPAARCRVRFANSVELVGCSLTQGDGVLWLRLRWILADVPASALMFFGHAVTARDSEADALAWFDQDMAVHGRGSWPRFEQDIVRSVSPGVAPIAFIRAGVCTFPDLERLEIIESSFDYDQQARCLFIPVLAKLAP